MSGLPEALGNLFSSVPKVFWEIGPIFLPRDSYHRFLLEISHTDLLKQVPPVHTAQAAVGYRSHTPRSIFFGKESCHVPP